MSLALPRSPEGLAAHLLAQVAATLARPLDHLDLARCLSASGLADLPPSLSAGLTTLASIPVFRGPLNRAVARALGFDALPLGPTFIERIASSARTRVCVLLISQPMALVRDAAAQVAATILHRRIVGLVFKTDRDRLRAALGDGTVQLASHEALLLHAPLIELDDTSHGADVIGDLSVEPDTRARFVRFGARMLTRFITLTEPALANVFDLRWSAEETMSDPAPARMTDEHCIHIVRLLRRRLSAWAAIIG